jgi:phosphatidylethanolamine-binding protein (PEBP) family uncharacterized protein
MVGCGANGDSEKPSTSTLKVTTLGRTLAQAPGAAGLSISSSAITDGGPIPVLYTCRGADMAPPLDWSSPTDSAIVVDDVDAPGGPYVHWIVVGIAPGPGHIADGGSAGGGITLPNSGGQAVYSGPCPPAGSGVHHYRFTLYQLPDDYKISRSLGGRDAVQAVTAIAIGQASFTGTVAG